MAIETLGRASFPSGRAVGVLAFALLVGCVDSTTSADGESSSSSDTTTGAPPRCDGAPGNCAMYSPCEVCGDLMSPFDEDGCLRTGCTDDMDCGAGERCFVGADFDTCTSSVGACEDDPVSMTCECQPNNDCSFAGWCVPEHIYPALEPSPAGVLVIEQSCGPVDGVLPSLRSYPVDTAVDCAAPPDGVDPQLELVFAQPGIDGAYHFSMMSADGSGTYSDDDGDVEVRAATLTVADLSGMTTDGSYTYVVYDGGGLSLYGEFFTAALSCPRLDPCG